MSCIKSFFHRRKNSYTVNSGYMGRAVTDQYRTSNGNMPRLADTSPGKPEKEPVPVKPLEPAENGVVEARPLPSPLTNRNVDNEVVREKGVDSPDRPPRNAIHSIHQDEVCHSDDEGPNTVPPGQAGDTSKEKVAGSPRKAEGSDVDSVHSAHSTGDTASTVEADGERHRIVEEEHESVFASSIPVVRVTEHEDDPDELRQDTPEPPPHHEISRQEEEKEEEEAMPPLTIDDVPVTPLEESQNLKNGPESPVDDLSPEPTSTQAIPRDHSPPPSPCDHSPPPSPRDRSPSPGPREASPSPSPRKASPSPAPRDRSPSPDRRQPSPPPSPRDPSTPPMHRNSLREDTEEPFLESPAGTWDARLNADIRAEIEAKGRERQAREQEDSDAEGGDAVATMTFNDSDNELDNDTAAGVSVVTVTNEVIDSRPAGGEDDSHCDRVVTTTTTTTTTMVSVGGSDEDETPPELQEAARQDGLTSSDDGIIEIGHVDVSYVDPREDGY